VQTAASSACTPVHRETRGAFALTVDARNESPPRGDMPVPGDTVAGDGRYPPLQIRTLSELSQDDSLDDLLNASGGNLIRRMTERCASSESATNPFVRATRSPIVTAAGLQMPPLYASHIPCAMTDTNRQFGKVTSQASRTQSTGYFAATHPYAAASQETSGLGIVIPARENAATTSVGPALTKTATAQSKALRNAIGFGFGANEYRRVPEQPQAAISVEDVNLSVPVGEAASGMASGRRLRGRRGS
jgi:hypothetical protein